MASGGVAGAIAFAIPGLGALGLTTWLALHATLILPTVFQPWIQRRAYKMAARSMLGAATATWVLGLLTPRTTLPRPIEIAVALGFMAVVARVLLTVRERKTPSPCTNCPMGAYPTCSWNMPRLLAGLEDQSAATAIGLSITTGQVFTSFEDLAKANPLPPSHGSGS